MREVSTLVNSVRNNSAELPLTIDQNANRLYWPG
jgi:hypothetical protein